MGTKKLFVVYTKRLATQLCDMGFELQGTRRNDQNPKWYVYLFENTPELRAAIEQYKGGGRNG